MPVTKLASSERGTPRPQPALRRPVRRSGSCLPAPSSSAAARTRTATSGVSITPRDTDRSARPTVRAARLRAGRDAAPRASPRCTPSGSCAPSPSAAGTHRRVCASGSSIAASAALRPRSLVCARPSMRSTRSRCRSSQGSEWIDDPHGRDEIDDDDPAPVPHRRRYRPVRPRFATCPDCTRARQVVDGRLVGDVERDGHARRAARSPATRPAR